MIWLQNIELTASWPRQRIAYKETALPNESANILSAFFLSRAS
jgi:hypothetical protein